MADRSKWQENGTVIWNNVRRRILLADDHGYNRQQQASLVQQVVREHNAHAPMVKLLRAMRENCSGVHMTDQATGETWADQISALLAKADPA